MFFTTNDIHFANIFDAFYESMVLLFFFESRYILIFRFDNYFLYISFQFIENFNHHENHIFLLTTSLRFFLGNQKTSEIAYMIAIACICGTCIVCLF